MAPMQVENEFEDLQVHRKIRTSGSKVHVWVLSASDPKQFVRLT